MNQQLKPKLKARAIQIAKIVHVVAVAVVVAVVVASQGLRTQMRIQALMKIPKRAKLKMMAPVLTVVAAAVAQPEMAQ
jgi:UPF0716 family protein affecting phage T7 exclusion